ncbi:MAG: ABC transporter permease [Propionibacteriaceae bacterium]|nr:ABC transporter permease [Propionibacteriaceae bacterium]
MKGIQIGLQGNLRRFILTVVVVGLAVGLGSSSLFMRGSVTSTISNVVDALLTADAYVFPQGSQPSDVVTDPRSQHRFLDAEILSQVTSSPGDKNVQAIYAGPVSLSYLDGKPISNSRIPCFGIGSDAGAISSYELVSGEYPTAPTEIALEQATARRAGLVSGDRASVVVNGNIFESVTITGIVSFDGDLAGTSVVLLAPHVARHYFAPSSMIPLVGLKFRESVTDFGQGVKAISESLEPGAKADVGLGKDVRARTAAKVDRSLSVLTYMAWAWSFICVAIGAALVTSIFAAAGRDRNSEIAIAKSFGVSRGQILAVICRQGLIVALIGGGLGILLGGLLSVILRWGISSMMGVNLTFSLPLFYLCTFFIAAVVLCTVAAWMGSRKAASLAPIEAIRGPLAPRAGIGGLRAIVGVVLGLVGGVGVVYAMFFSGGQKILIASVAAHLVGIILMAPLLVVLLMPLIAAPVRLVSSVSGRFAKKNARRSARRAGNIASVMIVGIAVATAGLLLTGSATINYHDRLAGDTAAEFVVTSVNGTIPDSSLTEVRQVQGVRVLPLGYAPARLLIGGHYQDARVMFTKPETFGEPNETRAVAGNIRGFGDGLAVSETFAARHKLHVGDELTFGVGVGTSIETTLTAPIGVVIDSGFFGDVLIPETFFLDSIPGHARSQFLAMSTALIRTSSTENFEQAKTELENTVESYPDLIVQTEREFLSQPDPQVTMMSVIVFAFVGLCTILAMISMAMMLGNAVQERRRETAVLKAGGATKGQLRRMVSFESLMISGTSALIGIAFGVGLAYVISSTLPGWPIHWTSIRVWMWIAGLFILAHIVGFIAGIPPALRAGQATVAHEE